MRAAVLLATALLALPALPSGAQQAQLEGVVRDPEGHPLAGATVVLHADGRGATTGADGAFRLARPPAEDVLVAALEGHEPAAHHVNRTAGRPLEVTLRRSEPGPERVEAWGFAGRFNVSVGRALEVSTPLEETLRFRFEVAAGAARAYVNVSWDQSEERNLRADVVHEPSGVRWGDVTNFTALNLTVPPALVRDRPGAYLLELRNANLAPLAGAAVRARVEVVHGPVRAKVVEGRPAAVADPAGDLRLGPVAPSADLLGVSFTNETDEQLDVVLHLANLGSTAPTAALHAGWAAVWVYGGQRYFVAFTSNAAPAPGAPAERFRAGLCDADACRFQRSDVIPGELRPGQPGTMVFRVPKDAVGRPADGAELGQVRGLTYESEDDALFVATAAEAAYLDATAVGGSYRLGAHEFAVAVGLPAGGTATVEGGALGGGAGGAGPVLALLAAAGGSAAALALGMRRRRSAPAVPPAKYEHLRALGEGASGRTYLARHRELGKQVAIKELGPRVPPGPAARERFLREARIGGALRHPNVVEVYDILESPRGVSIVMEYVDGGSLQDQLRDGRPWPLADALRLWCDVLAALEAVHAAGVVHRDVKPSNVLLTEAGVAKLADFGVAHSLREQTLGGEGMVGTPLYMAPEQVRGAEPTPASDVYAATAVAYRVLTGRAHLDPGGRVEALLDPARRPRPRLPDPALPEWVNRWLARGLDDDPGNRPVAAAMRRAVEDRLGGARRRTRPVPPAADRER